jgi:hypothetical protein
MAELLIGAVAKSLATAPYFYDNQLVEGHLTILNIFK